MPINPPQHFNRRARRRLEALLRRPDTTCYLCAGADRSTLVGIVAALASADDTLVGTTIIMPDGETYYIDADALRRGGHG
jgi:hypothetical protein